MTEEASCFHFKLNDEKQQKKKTQKTKQKKHPTTPPSNELYSVFSVENKCQVNF